MAEAQYKVQPIDPFSGKKLGRAHHFSIPSHEDAIARNETVTDTDEVPEGSIQRVMDWVGHDESRAKAALLHEQSRGQDEQRKSLIEQLHGRIAG